MWLLFQGWAKWCFPGSKEHICPLCLFCFTFQGTGEEEGLEASVGICSGRIGLTDCAVSGGETVMAGHLLLLTTVLSSGLVGKASLLTTVLFPGVCEKSSWELTAGSSDGVDKPSIVAGGNQEGGCWLEMCSFFKTFFKDNMKE